MTIFLFYPLKRQNAFKLSLGAMLFALTGCSMDASLMSLGSDILPDINFKVQRDNVDFVVGEIVTTSNGAVVKGSFGEISQKVQLSNGVKIEGVFYE